MRVAKTTIVALLMSIMVGCASTPSSRFYMLSPQTNESSSEGSITAGVVVGPVSMPELTNRPQIAVRVGPNQVNFDEFARWAEPLDSQVSSVVAANLSRLLNSQRVSAYSLETDPAESYRVRIIIQRFDGALGQNASIDALWSVQPPRSATRLTGRSITSETVSGNDYGSLVDGWSRALMVVSQDIAKRIEDSPPPLTDRATR